VIPYASEEDDREYFVDGKTIFVNKKHPAYVKELSRGRDFNASAMSLFASSRASVC